MVQIRLYLKKKSTFVLGNENPTRFPWFGNLYFTEFLKSITFPLKYNIGQSPPCSLLSPLGQTCPRRKNHQGVAQTERLLSKNQDWILLVIRGNISFKKQIGVCSPHRLKAVFDTVNKCLSSVYSRLLWLQKLMATCSMWRLLCELKSFSIPSLSYRPQDKCGLECWSFSKILKCKVFYQYENCISPC